MKAVRGSCGGAAQRGFIQRKSKQHSQWSWCVMAGYSTQLAAGCLFNKKERNRPGPVAANPLPAQPARMGLVAGVLNIRR